MKGLIISYTQFKLLAVVLVLLPALSQGLSLKVRDEMGQPIPQVMVSQTFVAVSKADLSDQGYAPNGVTNKTPKTITRFTDAEGKVVFADTDRKVSWRARAQGYVDANFTVAGNDLVLKKMTAEQNIASFPANVWLSQLGFAGDQQLKKSFQLNCAFCHQQASLFMRGERTVEKWLEIIERMNSYGARLPNQDHQRVANLLQQEYRQLREHPEKIPQPRPWDSTLANAEMFEWPLGDGFSQMHDFLVHPNGKVYIGDNLQDRLYEFNPETDDYTVYTVPHDKEATLGGILGNRFTGVPKVNNYLGVHSLAYSKKDGHIFITPSLAQGLLEFNPDTKEYAFHKMDEGFYPHTIRIDNKDRVWFTLALSSQVAMFDRDKKTFKYYDLPTRGFKEWMIIKSLPLVFWMDPENRPLPDADRAGTGLPMPYGIDVAPDGSIWVARLYANDLAKIDPESGEVTMLEFPYQGPRRLRVDAQNKVWIVAFQDSLLVKYDPVTSQYTAYDLPVINEIPYALNVDRERGVVWVNGNQSDTILAFNISSESWKVYPLPRQRFFSRDIEINEKDGSIYTTNSHFPSWQSEGGIPTLIRIKALPPATPSAVLTP